MKVLYVLAFALLVVCPGFADNRAFTGSGGSFSPGSSGGSITASSVPIAGTSATYTLTCPITYYAVGTYQINWTCTNGTLFVSTPDNSIVLHAKIPSATMIMTASGGGRGGITHYYYSFFGQFTGAAKSNGAIQTVNGSLSQSVVNTKEGSGTVKSALLGWNSAYSPLLVAAASTLYQADNISGANIRSYGKAGSSTGEFAEIAGLALDASSHILIADSGNNRIVRINNIGGSGWTTFGSTGSGANQFSAPRGIAIDSTGRIYVADSGNNRIVRFNDLTGTGWTAFGSAGAGTNQFSSPSGIAFDAAGHIYVADTGNNRLVRIDDMSGTNWTTLSQVNIDPYGYPLAAAPAVLVDSTGRIFVPTAGVNTSYLISFTDMTGANPQISAWSGSFIDIAMDKAGTLYTAGTFTSPLAQVVNSSANGYFAASLGLGSFTPTALVALPISSPPPADPVLSVSSLNFGNHNVGESSNPAHVFLSNIGGAPLALGTASAGADFPVSNGCATSVSAGATCTLAVTFDATATGVRSSTLVVNSTSAHPSLGVSLAGFGTVPNPVLLPTSLAFDAQQSGTASAAQLATLTNTGTGPLTITSITPIGAYTQTNNCPNTLAPGAGCTLNIAFAPNATGPLSGAITISDDAVPTGTTQTISLSGSGSSSAPAFTVSPENLYFPDQLLGTTSLAQSVTITNHSGATVALGTSSAPSPFTTNACASTLANGASCTLSVKFAPASTGAFTGTLALPVTGLSSIGVGLSGTAVSSAKPVLKLSPASTNFGVLQIGDSISQNVTLTNTSGLPARAAISLSGADYSISSNTCTGMLAAAATCTVQITLNPTNTAIYNGTLTITESSGAKSQATFAASATVNGS